MAFVWQIVEKMALMTTRIYIILVLTILAGSGAGVLAQEGERRGRRGDGEQRQFDVGAMMVRLDVNKNGILDANELNDRTRDFLGRMGVENNGNALVIADVVKKIEERRSGRTPEAEPQRTRSSSADTSATLDSFRKLPGFDAPASASGNLSGFVNSVAVARGGKSYDQMPASVREEVENTLRRYDKNGDGLIDAEEMKEMRWRAPTATESDLNGDGVLSRDEIAHRYSQRETAVSQNSGSNSGRDNSRQPGDSDRGGNRGRDGGRNDSGRDEGRGGGSQSPMSGSSGSNQSSSRGSSGGGIDYRKYAEEMLEKYDVNKDGTLDKDEFSKLRRQPPNADRDKDGVVTLQELTDAFEEMERSGGTSSSGGSSSATSSGDNNSSERGSRSFGRGGGGSGGAASSRGSSSGSFSISEYDKNGDGQVEMWEFTNSWTAEKLADFRKWDKNNDGVITADEVRNR